MTKSTLFSPKATQLVKGLQRAARKALAPAKRNWRRARKLLQRGSGPSSTPFTIYTGRGRRRRRRPRRPRH